MAKVGFVRRLVAFVLAIALTAALGAVVQTQFNLAALSALGVDINWSVRMDATLHDLTHFSPLFAILVTVGFLCAFPVAALISVLLHPIRSLVFALAAVAALYSAFFVVNNLLPMPTLVAATRTWEGLVAMCAVGLVGGWIYAGLTRRKRRGGWDNDIGMRFR